MSSALREILAHFGFEVEDEKLDSLDHRIGELSEKFKQFGEVIAASFLGERLHEFMEDQIRIGEELDTTADRLGVSTDQLQRFQFAMGQSGASAEEATQAVRFFNRALGEAKTGDADAAQTFAKLHLNLKDLTDESIPLTDKIGLIADKFGELKTHGEKAAFATRIFGRGGAAMIPILSEGREKVEELLESYDELGGGMQRDFIDASVKSEKASKKLRFALQNLKSRIAVELIPGLTATTERFTEWAQKALKLAKSTNVLKTSLTALKLGAFVGIITKIWKMMGMAEGGVWGFVKSLFKLGPIVLMALALYLIFDDLYTLFTGGESTIGKLIDELFGVGASEEVVTSVKEAWQDFIDFLGSDGGDTIKMIARLILGSLVVACDSLITAGELIGETFAFAWDAVAGKLTDADKDLENMKKHVDDFKSHFNKVGDWVAGKTAPSVEVGKILSGPQAQLPTRQATSVTTGAAAGGGNPYGPQKIEINNHISGVSDPKAAGEHAGRMTKEAIGGKKLRDAYGAVGGG